MVYNTCFPFKQRRNTLAKVQAHISWYSIEIIEPNHQKRKNNEMNEHKPIP